MNLVDQPDIHGIKLPQLLIGIGGLSPLLVVLPYVVCMCACAHTCTRTQIAEHESSNKATSCISLLFLFFPRLFCEFSPRLHLMMDYSIRRNKPYSSNSAFGQAFYH